MEMTETPKGEVWKITVTATYAERWLSGLKKLCRIMRLHTLTLPEEKTLFVCGGESSATVRCLASLAARFPKELRIRRFDPPKKMHLQFEWEKPSFFSWHGGLALETVRKSIMHSPDIDPLARFFRAAMEETAPAYGVDKASPVTDEDVERAWLALTLLDRFEAFLKRLPPG